MGTPFLWLLVIVLTCSLVLMVMAYVVLRDETKQLRIYARGLVGLRRVLGGVFDEMKLSWSTRLQHDTEDASSHEIGVLTSRCLQAIHATMAHRIAFSSGEIRLEVEDFSSAGVLDPYQRLNTLISTGMREDLKAAWHKRRVQDLVSILRLVQTGIDKEIQAKLEEAKPEPHNQLLKLLMDKAPSAAICEDIQVQIRLLELATGRLDDTPERTAAALKAVVDALCYRRDHMRKPLSIGVLVQALDGRNLEQLYRDCASDAEAPGGGWRPEYEALRAYVDSLPGWDGRLPFNGITIATHNSVASIILGVLNRVF